MTALTFLTVGVLRAGMISTAGALAVILGGCIGSSVLVLIVTLDVNVLALGLLGISGIAVASETLAKHRRLAASLFGGGLLVFGLTLLQESAAPFAEQAWFEAMLAHTRNTGLSAPVADQGKTGALRMAAHARLLANLLGAAVPAHHCVQPVAERLAHQRDDRAGRVVPDQQAAVAAPERDEPVGARAELRPGHARLSLRPPQPDGISACTRGRL